MPNRASIRNSRKPSSFGGAGARSGLAVCLLVSLFCFAVSVQIAPWAVAASSSFEDGARLFGLGQFAEALASFDKSVDSEPTNAEFHYWRGRCLAELNRRKEAQGEFKVASLLGANSQIRDLCKRELAALNGDLSLGMGKDAGSSSGGASGGSLASSGEGGSAGAGDKERAGQRKPMDDASKGDGDEKDALASSKSDLSSSSASGLSNVGASLPIGAAVSNVLPISGKSDDGKLAMSQEGLGRNGISKSIGDGKRSSVSSGKNAGVKTAGSAKSTSSKEGNHVRLIQDADSAPVLSGNGKVFKLTSKKLEWDMKVSAELKNQLASGNQRLDNLARGTRWALPPMGRGAMPVNLAAELSRGPAHFNSSLSEAEKKVLTASDIVIVLDHSGSMSTADCPSYGGGAQSRLSWCVEEILAFAQPIMTALPHGFALITFDSRPDVHYIRSVSELQSVLHGLNDGGGTDLSKALDEAYRIHFAHPRQPLLIALVTDAEIDVRSSENTILEGCRRFPLPNGVFISLMQIGIRAEASTADTLALFDDLTTKSNAPYDAVDTVPFSKLRHDGLGRDILVGLQRNFYSNAAMRSAAGGGASGGTGTSAHARAATPASKSASPSQSAPSSASPSPTASPSPSP